MTRQPNRTGRWSVVIFDEDAVDATRCIQRGVGARLTACQAAETLSEDLPSTAVVQVICAHGTRRIYQHGKIIYDYPTPPIGDDVPIDW